MTCDPWDVTGDTWQLTGDRWQMTLDTWHMTPDLWHLNFKFFSSSFFFVFLLLSAHVKRLSVSGFFTKEKETNYCFYVMKGVTMYMASLTSLQNGAHPYCLSILAWNPSFPTVRNKAFILVFLTLLYYDFKLVLL